MKFVYALIAIFVAITGVHAGAPTTANSVYIDFQIKLCSVTIDLLKVFMKIGDNLYAAALTENKTIAAGKTNASIADLIKKILGPLDKVQNQTIKDALLVLNGTVTGCVGLIDTFNVQAYSDAGFYLNIRNYVVKYLYSNFQTTFATFLSAIASSVTDASINVSKVADCQKAAYASFDAVMKDVSARYDKCYKDFSVNEAKIYLAQINKVYAAILQCASKSINNVTYCMKNNKISDAKGMDSTTNCTRDSFMTCITWGQTDSKLFVSTDFSILANDVDNNENERSFGYSNCNRYIWTVSDASFVLISAAFATCVNNAPA